MKRIKSDLLFLLQDGKHVTELVTHTLLLSLTVLLQRAEPGSMRLYMKQISDVLIW